VTTGTKDFNTALHNAGAILRFYTCSLLSRWTAQHHREGSVCFRNILHCSVRLLWTYVCRSVCLCHSVSDWNNHASYAYSICLLFSS